MRSWEAVKVGCHTFYLLYKMASYGKTELLTRYSSPVLPVCFAVSNGRSLSPYHPSSGQSLTSALQLNPNLLCVINKQGMLNWIKYRNSEGYCIFSCLIKFKDCLTLAPQGVSQRVIGVPPSRPGTVLFWRLQSFPSQRRGPKETSLVNLHVCAVHKRFVNTLSHIGSGRLSSGTAFALKYCLFSYSMSARGLEDNICSLHVHQTRPHQSYDTLLSLNASHISAFFTTTRTDGTNYRRRDTLTNMHCPGTEMTKSLIGLWYVGDFSHSVKACLKLTDVKD